VPTKRGRFFWAAWWTAPPEARPFRAPDAFSGGALTREEARADAERAAGRSLVEINGHWAGAWVRIRRGQAPWPAAREPRTPAAPSPPPVGSPSWARETLGLGRDATAEEVTRAFRAAAFRTHPDRGGDEAAFIAVRRAFEVAQAAVLSPRPRRRRR
jgi:hypothetical protein